MGGGGRNEAVVSVNQVRMILVLSSTLFVSAHVFVLMIGEQQGGKNLHSSNIIVQNFYK